MAMLIRGRSVCHLCDGVIGEVDDIKQFPPALFDPTSEVAHLNDSSVHTACFEELPEAQLAQKALDDFLGQWVP